jgi:glycosyltransferase involved in cell wall biosynthesis
MILWITIKKTIRYARQNGLLDTLFHIKAMLISGYNPFTKVSVIDNYAELFGDDFGSVPDAKNISASTINWFIPPLSKGSGGHLNIFRFIKNLEDLGYQSNIVIVGGPSASSVKSAKSNIEKWFFPLKAEVFIGMKNVPASYFAIATSWPTAYYVQRFQGCFKKCYFVQDFEPWFYPSGTESALSENTYKLGFYGITAGGWLANKLYTEYGMQTSSVGFSFDNNLYKPMPELKKNDGLKRVFFYARPQTPRRAFELGLLVLNEVCKELPNVEVIFAGRDLSEFIIPFPHKVEGLVALDKLAEIYSQCDVALVLSFSNVSLLPLELMACRVPVVSNRAPNIEWLLDDQACMLAEPDITSLKNSIVEVLNNNKLSERLKDLGQSLANQTSWQSEAKKFSDILVGLVGY